MTQSARSLIVDAFRCPSHFASPACPVAAAVTTSHLTPIDAQDQWSAYKPAFCGYPEPSVGPPRPSIPPSPRPVHVRIAAEILRRQTPVVPSPMPPPDAAGLSAGQRFNIGTSCPATTGTAAAPSGTVTTARRSPTKCTSPSPALQQCATQLGDVSVILTNPTDGHSFQVSLAAPRPAAAADAVAAAAAAAAAAFAQSTASGMPAKKNKRPRTPSTDSRMKMGRIDLPRELAAAGGGRPAPLAASTATPGSSYEAALASGPIDGGAGCPPAAPFQLKAVPSVPAPAADLAPAAAVDHGEQESEWRFLTQQSAEDSDADRVADAGDSGGASGGGGVASGGAEDDDPLWQLWLAGGEPDGMTDIFEGLEQAGRDRAEDGCWAYRWRGAGAPHADALPVGAAF